MEQSEKDQGRVIRTDEIRFKTKLKVKVRPELLRTELVLLPKLSQINSLSFLRTSHGRQCYFSLSPHILKKIVIDETTREANLVHNTHPTHGKTESELLKPRLKKKKGKKKKETQRRQKSQTQAFELKQRIREAVRFLITNRAQKVEHGKKMKRSIKTASNLGSI